MVPAEVAAVAQELALRGSPPPEAHAFGSQPAWRSLAAAGTRLWLDTGDLEAARGLWCDEMSALTTNNTLVNKEVQKGTFDGVIRDAAAALRAVAPGISPAHLVTEIGFVVNCRSALRLVAAFGARVSVELHPGMSADVARSVEYGRRYFAVCPEHFLVKVPLTPAGFVAARNLADEGIPVNYTLGFSARQNVLAAAYSRPAYGNVFMGRLGSFVKDAGLGDGANVGERATMATQMAFRQGRASRGWTTLLIGASMRNGNQLYDLAGLDVFTIPPAAAEEYRRRYDGGETDVRSHVGRDFPVVTTAPELFACLWDVDDAVYHAAAALAQAHTPTWTGQAFADAARDLGLGNLCRSWAATELDEIRAGGKIPHWDRWGADIQAGRVALDDLMSQAALQSFVTDQADLDHRIASLIA